MIGPWSHSGFLDNRVGHGVSGRRSKFNHLTHILAFFDRCCGRTSPPETVAALANTSSESSEITGALSPCNLPAFHCTIEPCKNLFRSEDSCWV